MNEPIQQNRQVDIPIVQNIGVQPVEQKDGSVVVHMQKAKLLPLLIDHNENGIPEIPNFGDIENPKQIGNGRVNGIKRLARQEGVIVAVGKKASLQCHVRAQHHLRDVVKEFEWVGIDGRDSARFHNCATDDNERNIGNRNGGSRAEIGQPPALKR